MSRRVGWSEARGILVGPDVVRGDGGDSDRLRRPGARPTYLLALFGARRIGTGVVPVFVVDSIVFGVLAGNHGGGSITAVCYLTLYIIKLLLM